MKKPLYLFSGGHIKRQDHTLTIENVKEKHYKPIEAISELYCFGEYSFNSKFFNFLGQKKTPFHLFNYYGFYTGSFYPREEIISGLIVLKQSQYYLDQTLRLQIAQEFLDAAASNILSNLNYYKNREKEVTSEINSIKEIKKRLKEARTLMALMGMEGNIRQLYYKAFEKIINQEISFEKREKRPPNNLVNTLISFGNTLCYTAVLSQIYRTQLNPLISFLHEPGNRRFSLSLDIAEIFKPVLVDRLIFTMLNRREITVSDTEKHSNFCYLKESARKTFIRKWEEKLQTTVMQKNLKKKVSYRRLISLECYKLIKHLLKEKKYTGFKMWW